MVRGEGICAQNTFGVIEISSDARVFLLGGGLHAPMLTGSALGAVALIIISPYPQNTQDRQEGSDAAAQTAAPSASRSSSPTFQPSLPTVRRAYSTTEYRVFIMLSQYMYAYVYTPIRAAKCTCTHLIELLDVLVYDFQQKVSQR